MLYQVLLNIKKKLESYKR